MTKNSAFEIEEFLPYLLNQAADASSRGFEIYYKSKYEMLRTEWRVVFHLGHYGELTAKDICTRARVHKTKVSRAIRALEAKKYLIRTPFDHDKRHEKLNLTVAGQRVFEDLSEEAARFDAQIMSRFTQDERKILRHLLSQLAKL